MDRHLGASLSAYLDGELPVADRAEADRHLAACAACATQLAELRATSRLVAALPLPAPSRRLVPRVTQRVAWLRPLRSVSAVATGAFVFLFIGSAVLETDFRMGGGTTAGAPAPQEAARRRDFGPILGSPRIDTSAAQRGPADAPTAGPIGATGASGATGARAFGPAGAVGAAGPTGTPPPPAAFGFASPAPTSLEKAADAARVDTSAAPGAVAPQPSPGEARAMFDEVTRPSLGSPWLWLALALASALLALTLHRRLSAS